MDVILGFMRADPQSIKNGLYMDIAHELNKIIHNRDLKKDNNGNKPSSIEFDLNSTHSNASSTLNTPKISGGSRFGNNRLFNSFSGSLLS